MVAKRNRRLVNVAVDGWLRSTDQGGVVVADRISFHALCAESTSHNITKRGWWYDVHRPWGLVSSDN